VKDKGQTATLIVPVTVLPVPVAAPAAVPVSLQESVISWKRSPNALSYEVKVKDEVVCQTATTSCTAPVTVGPKTKVEVAAVGGDKLTSVVPATYQPNKPLPAIIVNFKTGSSVLSAAQKAELNKIAKVMQAEGFVRVVVNGHTDSVQGMDNQKLSLDRAKATAAYLAQLVPGIDFVARGYGQSKPVSSNDSDAGKAANRRAELSLW
jgi:outer membrane protein OmpA-like peptidoglycan-associated protein